MSQTPSIRQRIVESHTKDIRNAGRQNVQAAGETLADLAFQYANFFELKDTETTRVKEAHDTTAASDAAAEELAAKAKALGANDWDIACAVEKGRAIAAKEGHFWPRPRHEFEL